jgi:hypothetical protein
MEDFVVCKPKNVFGLPRLHAPSSVALMTSKSSKLLSIVRRKKIVLPRLPLPQLILPPPLLFPRLPLPQYLLPPSLPVSPVLVP